ncbi:hypothetical protein C9E17_18820 [Escherichia coli]|nr:hypothetical protein C9E17_18820 [Escherichia coli]
MAEYTSSIQVPNGVNPLSLNCSRSPARRAYLSYSPIIYSPAMEVEFPLIAGNDSNLLIVFYVQIMPDDFVMQLHRF